MSVSTLTGKSSHSKQLALELSYLCKITIILPDWLRTLSSGFCIESGMRAVPVVHMGPYSKLRGTLV